MLGGRGRVAAELPVELSRDVTPVELPGQLSWDCRHRHKKSKIQVSVLDVVAVEAGGAGCQRDFRVTPDLDD